MPEQSVTEASTTEKRLACNEIASIKLNLKQKRRRSLRNGAVLSSNHRQAVLINH